MIIREQFCGKCGNKWNGVHNNCPKCGKPLNEHEKGVFAVKPLKKG